jgi:hypothetical protein
MAVGTNGTSVLAEAWNGRTWAKTPIPAPPGVAYTSLESVSCSAPDTCVAVGNYQTDPMSSGQAPVAEVWDGTAWTMTSAP